jgi:FkbM family methyltransferase
MTVVAEVPSQPFVTNPLIRAVRDLPGLRYLAFRLHNFLAKRTATAQSCVTYFGAELSCDPTDYIQRMLLNFGFWEPNISAYISSALSLGDVFVDIGANVGYDTLLGSRLVGQAGSVISIEMSPSTFAILSDNISRNGVRNVRAVQVGVSDHRAVVPIYVAGPDSLGLTTTVASRGFVESGQAEIAPLDEILQPDEIARLRLIKMDIEGAEAPVMRRLIDKMRLYPPGMEVITEVSDATDNDAWKQIFSDMRASGFKTYMIENGYDDSWYLAWRGVAPPKPLHDVPSGQCDVLFTRRTL